MKPLLRSLAGVTVAAAALAMAQPADAQVTFTPAPTQPVYSGPVAGQPVYTYPYGYAPGTTYRSSQYVAPGTQYVAPTRPTYDYSRGRYTTQPYGTTPRYYYSPYSYGQPASPYTTQPGYTTYPYGNSPVNLTIPGVGNIGFGRR